MTGWGCLFGYEDANIIWSQTTGCGRQGAHFKAHWNSCGLCELWSVSRLKSPFTRDHKNLGSEA